MGLRYTLAAMKVTIDGPAGSGKSTAARGLARELGIAYLDTGATYRAATLRAMRHGVGLSDEQALARCAAQADIRLTPEDGGVRVLLDGQDVSEAIREPDVTDTVHHLANSPAVREVLVALQRRVGEQFGSFVTEGRDQGTVVFPDADLRVFLEAAPEVRAMRRYEELLARGRDADYMDVLRKIIERDGRDRTRSVGPLVKPRGALHIDSSDLSPEQVVREILRHLEQQA